MLSYVAQAYHRLNLLYLSLYLSIITHRYLSGWVNVATTAFLTYSRIEFDHPENAERFNTIL